MSTETITHAGLVSRGARWLNRSYGCGVVLTENTSVSGETPDIIGWKGTGRSVLVEVKVSRSDYLADAKKPHRLNPLVALGAERYYLAPKGLIKATELPPDWGLIEATAQRFKIVVPARPRKDLRSDLSKKYEMQMLIRALEHVALRIQPAPMWTWLEYKNREMSPVQAQNWVSKEDHIEHIRAQEGWELVVNPLDLPEDEATGEPWCPKHETDFASCMCIAPGEMHVEYREIDGKLYARPMSTPHFKRFPAQSPEQQMSWLLKREEPAA